MFAWSILNLIIKSHGESWTRYFATVIYERDGEMKVWVQSFSYYNRLHLNIIKIFITAILLTSLIFQACINHFIWPRWIVNEMAKRMFAWSILNLIIKSHGESWTRYFATVIYERDGEMEVWVQSFNYYNTLKHNKNLYYSNPAYKLDFLSLH